MFVTNSYAEKPTDHHDTNRNYSEFGNCNEKITEHSTNTSNSATIEPWILDLDPLEELLLHWNTNPDDPSKYRLDDLSLEEGWLDHQVMYKDLIFYFYAKISYKQYLFLVNKFINIFQLIFNKC